MVINVFLLLRGFIILLWKLCQSKALFHHLKVTRYDVNPNEELRYLITLKIMSYELGVVTQKHSLKT